MMGKYLSEQAIYKILRDLDSDILEKYGFGSCNLSPKYQVGFMIGFVSLITSFCEKDVKSNDIFSAAELAEIEEEDGLMDLQEKLVTEFKVDYLDLVDKSKEELAEMLQQLRSSKAR